MNPLINHISLVLLWCIAAATPDRAASTKVSSSLIQSPESLTKLITRLSDSANDADVRPALHNLALYVSRSGADAERKVFAHAIGDSPAELPTSARLFLIQQLQIAHATDAAEDLGKLLLDPGLGVEAARVLSSFNQPSDALLAALSKAEGRNRLAVIQAMGILRDSRAVPQLIDLAADKDRDTRLAAIEALGNIGEISAARILIQASEVDAPFERGKCTAALLRLASRLLEANQPMPAARIYRVLWTGRMDDPHIRCAALTGLVAASGEGVLEDIASALDSDNEPLRAVALNLGASVPGPRVTKWWIDRLRGAAPEAQPTILNLLALRRDPSALDAIAANLNAEPSARFAAINALGFIGSAPEAQKLIPFLETSDTPQRRAAEQALIRLPGADAAIAAALSTASPKTTTTLLSILAARSATSTVDKILPLASSKDPSVAQAAFSALAALADHTRAPALLDLFLAAPEGTVRNAAEKAVVSASRANPESDQRAKPVLDRLASTTDPTIRIALFKLIPNMGGRSGLDAVRQSLRDTDPDVQTIAIRTLADWVDTEAMTDLKDLAKISTNETHQVLAFRGYLRLLALSPARSDQKALLYEEAFTLARRPDETRLVLSGLSNVRNTKALELALKYLAEQAVREEAAAAVVAIAQSPRNIAREALKPALERVVDVTKDDRTRRQATELLKRL